MKTTHKNIRKYPLLYSIITLLLILSLFLISCGKKGAPTLEEEKNKPSEKISSYIFIYNKHTIV